MPAGEVRAEIDQQRVREILDSFVLPTEFDKFDIVFGTDWSGDPSVSLTFHVKDEIAIDDAKLKKLTRFLNEVTSVLLQGDIGGYVYTHLEQAA